MIYKTGTFRQIIFKKKENIALRLLCYFSFPSGKMSPQIQVFKTARILLAQMMDISTLKKKQSVMRIIHHQHCYLLTLCLINGVAGVGEVRHGLFLGGSKRKSLEVWFLSIHSSQPGVKLLKVGG